MAKKNRTWNIYMSRGTMADLTAIAGLLKYVSSGGPGAGKLPSASAMIDALAVGEAVLLPAPSAGWETLLTLLERAADRADNPPEAKALRGLAKLIHAQVNLPHGILEIVPEKIVRE